MHGIHLFSTIRVLVTGVFIVGLAVPVLAQSPPQAGPIDDIQATLGIVLDRLDDLETKIDNQSADLKGVTQNWDKKLDSTNGEANGCNSDRFTCLWPDENSEPTAVRDNETGLVWDRSPDPDTFTVTWGPNNFHCTKREVGNRLGWSLPTFEQLATLLDRSNTDPALPTDHPFLNVLSSTYWTSSTFVGNPDIAVVVNFGSGGLGVQTKGIAFPVWCVRGGQVLDKPNVQLVIEKIDATHP